VEGLAYSDVEDLHICGFIVLDGENEVVYKMCRGKPIRWLFECRWLSSRES
jgi:hypothetical protein